MTLTPVAISSSIGLDPVRTLIITILGEKGMEVLNITDENVIGGNVHSEMKTVLG